jgi:hypothetical protein
VKGGPVDRWPGHVASALAGVGRAVVGTAAGSTLVLTASVAEKVHQTSPSALVYL